MSAGLLLPYRHRWPHVAPSAFVAAGSSVIGDVVLGAQASVWFNCVLRGDVNRIHIGARSNIQDGTIIHTATADGPTLIGDGVVVGHMCLLHACALEDGCMIGMGATVMDQAVVETGAWVAAGALVTPGKRGEERRAVDGPPGAAHAHGEQRGARDHRDHRPALRHPGRRIPGGLGPAAARRPGHAACT